MSSEPQTESRPDPRVHREILYGAVLIRALRAMDIDVPAEDEIEAGVAAMDLERLRLDWLREGYESCEAEARSSHSDVSAAPSKDDTLRQLVVAALTDEDEIAHAEAWHRDSKHDFGLGKCAYCGHPWPCHTQQAIDRLLSKIAATDPTPTPKWPDVSAAARDYTTLTTTEFDAKYPGWADDAGFQDALRRHFADPTPNALPIHAAALAEYLAPDAPSKDDTLRLDEELRSFIQEAEYGAEDNGSKAVLIEDLWAMAAERKRQRSGHVAGQIALAATDPTPKETL